MTITKPMKKEGGAAIASRLRLDTPAPVKGTNSKSLKFAFSAALVSLAVAGILTYLLWKHWEFLMPA